MALTILKTAFVAVFLFAAACGGDDSFEPAPGASIAIEDFEGLIAAAVAGQNFEEVNSMPMEAQRWEDPRPSCFEVEVGPCSVGDPQASLPGHAVRYRDPEGREVTVQLQLAVDDQHSGELVEGQVSALRSMETQAWRFISSPTTQPGEAVTSGPCDSRLDPDEDKGCAWQARGAPKVGDSVGAVQSNVVPDSGYAAVAFSRVDVFAMVMVRQYESGTPGRIADDIARALDEQIKLALSR